MAHTTPTGTTEQVTYGALQNGDHVWIQGYLFEVRNVRVSSRKGERTAMHAEPNRDDVIRFEGHTVQDVDIARTGYNGGTYGAYAFVLVSREVTK